MSVKNYYEKYWNGQINGGILNDVPDWSEENLNWHADFFKEYIGKTVLDVGAGDGTFLNHIQKNFPGRRCVAFELSDQAVAIGTRKHPDLEFQAGDSGALPFADRSFSTVMMIEVAEHILDIDQALSECSRVLTDGGHLCITTTDFNLLKKVVIAALFFDRFFYPNNPHIRFFTKKSLAGICRSHGFETVKYKWNKSYFGIMPKGQMAVFQKVDIC